MIPAEMYIVSVIETNTATSICPHVETVTNTQVPWKQSILKKTQHGRGGCVWPVHECIITYNEMGTDSSLETLKCASFTSLILGREGGERRKGRREQLCVLSMNNRVSVTRDICKQLWIYMKRFLHVNLSIVQNVYVYPNQYKYTTPCSHLTVTSSTAHPHNNLFDKFHFFGFSSICRGGIFWQQTCKSRNCLCKENIVITAITW